MLPRFTLADLDVANDAWRCNCGPSAIAAICGLTLDEVRSHMGDFEDKGYTNPTLMVSALRSLRQAKMLADAVPMPLSTDAITWPRWGLCRIQWEGPWTRPGVPMRARYRATHWVGSCVDKERGVGVWDCNALSNGTGWVSLETWAGVVVPFLVESYPKANGKWHITHSIEVML